MLLFIPGSGQPLPWAECALGLDFNQMGPWQSCPGGPHGSNAPLGMMNEPADSSNAAQLLWGAGVRRVGKGCSPQSQDPVTEELPLPQSQTIAWHPQPQKETTKRESAMQAPPLTCFWSPRVGRNLEGPPVPIAGLVHSFISESLGLDGEEHIFSLAAPMARKFLLLSNLSQGKRICNSVPQVIP